ncbi:hypothetical protein ACPPVO_01635 [Dactylosporangium sp. McL0621]|uniref:hypothetical protein n=1 Tax=Dactylosporangium sp. McL0621 TaxID=3415678 RepID=UPI003CEC1BFD
MSDVVIAEADTGSVAKRKPARLEVHGVDEQLVAQLVEPARTAGLQLTGDLWTVNVMLDPDAAPTITGLLDLTGPCGAIRRLTGRFGWCRRSLERSATRSGRPTARRTSRSPLGSGAWCTRRGISGAIRLERYRLGKPDGADGTYRGLAEVVAHLP